MKRFVAVVASLALLGSALSHAAGWQEKLERIGYSIGEPAEEIQNYRLSGWNHLDSKHLTVTTGPSERYLITLKTRCQDLSTAENIGFSNTVNRLTRFDKVVVRGPGGIKQECLIDTIHKLDKTS